MRIAQSNTIVPVSSRAIRNQWVEGWWADPDWRKPARHGVVLACFLVPTLGCAAAVRPDFSKWNAASENVGRAEVVVAGDNHNEHPAVSSTGRLIFESDRGGNWDIWMIELGGGGRSAVQQLTTNPGPDVSPSVTGDGQSFVFVSTRLSGVTPSYFMSRVGSSAATEIAPVEAPAVGPYTPGRISPDGELIAYTSGRYVWTTNVHTGVRTQVLEGYQPVWNPVTGGLLFRRKARDFGLYVSTGLWSAKADGSEVTEVIPGGERVSINGGEYSPDGRRLCFERTAVDHGRLPQFAFPDVFVANADGSSPVQVTTAPGYDGDCTWRDNGHLLFVSDRPVPGSGRKWHFAIWQVTLPSQ